jgi:hypothetical protein
MTDIASDAGANEIRPTRTKPIIPKEAWDADGGFFLAMALVAAAIIFAGFAPSFYLKSVIHAPPPLSVLTVTHGLVFTAWMLLFITQTALIATKRPAPHRQLGILGALLFGAMVSLGYSTALTAGRLGHAPPGAPAPLVFMALPLIAMTAALVLVAAGLWNRRRSDWHKRLMLASIFAMTGPGTGRIAIPLGFAPQGTWLALIVADILLAAAIAYDFRRQKRVHPAYALAAIVFAVTNAGVAWAFGSESWMSFAKALTQA